MKFACNLVETIALVAFLPFMLCLAIGKTTATSVVLVGLSIMDVWTDKS